MYNCTPVEVYLVNGFINFNPLLMDGMLVLRRPMHTLW
jgi:inorganic pyrophosphatase